MKTTSVVIFFFPKVSFRKLWYTVMITAMFKVLYQQSRVNLTTAFESHLTTEYFMDIVSSLHQDIELIIVCFSFSQTSLVFKFNLMLIEWFLPQFIYLSTFWYCVLKFIPYLYALFIRARKFSWTSCCFFVKVYNYKLSICFFIFDETLVPVSSKNYWR